MGNLYQLIPNAFTIYSDAYARIGEIGFDAVEAAADNSPRQPVLEDQLIHCASLFYELNSVLVLNDDGDAIIAVNIDTSIVNSLLLQLRDAAGLNTLSQFPTPLTDQEFTQIVNGNYAVGGLGAILQSNGTTYLPLEMGAPGEVLTSTPTGLVWSSVVGNGIPSGGTTGQYLNKVDNTSYNVQWSTLTVSKITDLAASAAELNILDGVTGVGAVDINQLAGVSSNIQIQLNNRLSNSLQNGRFFVGNIADVATAVTPSGVVTFDNAGVFSITNDSIVDADINSAAAITRSKIASGSANRMVVNSSLGVMTDAAAITASRVLVSDANGIPVASGVTTTTLGFLDVSSSIQTSLDERLVVDLTGVAQGDLLTYNGTDWINLGVGTAGQVITTNGTSVSWGSAAANGLPVGGSTNQILRKIDGTNYNTEWHTLVLADVTDVSTTSTELNLLSGLTVGSSVINFLDGATANVQDQLDGKLTASLTYHAIFIGGPGNTAQQIGPGSDGSVLTVVAGHPTWQTPPAPGNVSGPVSSTDNAIVRWNLAAGDSIQNSGVILDDSNNTTYPTGAALRTSTSAGNTLLLQAYDVDGTAYVTWATLTANDTVSFDIHTSTTIGSAYIYRVGGTDVSLADGGTGASLSDPGANRLWGWDDTDGAIAFITIGTNLSYDHATHTLSASGGVSSVTLTGDVTGTGTGTVATTIADAAVTYAKFQDVAGLSVVGRSANSSGVSAAITAGSDGDILRRSGTSIGFGTIGISSMTMNTNRILARTTASAGPVQEITAMYGLSLASGELFPAYEIVIESGTTLTIDATYRNKVVYCTSAAQVDITLTDEAEGFGVIFVKQGTGNLVFAVDTGLDPLLAVSDTISIQNTAATFVKQDATTWTGFGSLGTSGGGGLVPENGLSETNPGFVGLGGTALSMDTTIDGNTGTYSFTFTGLSNLILEDVTEDNTVTKILALDTGNAVKWIDVTDIGGSSFYQTVQESGTPLTQRANLNFTSGLLAADDGSGATDVSWNGTLFGDTEIGGNSSLYGVYIGQWNSLSDPVKLFNVSTSSGQISAGRGIILQTSDGGIPVSLAIDTSLHQGKIYFDANSVESTGPYILPGYATGSLPIASSHTRGLAYDTTTGTVKVSNGSAWVEMVAGGSTGMTFVGIAGTLTMSGTLEADNGGTGQTSYAIGDLLYASTTSALSKLAAVAAGSYLRSAGTGTAPVWSTTTLPNSATTGDLLYASTTNVYSNLAGVATGNVLISGGVAAAPSWGKVTSSHVNETIWKVGGNTLTGTSILGDLSAGGFAVDLYTKNLVRVRVHDGSDTNSVTIYTTAGTNSHRLLNNGVHYFGTDSSGVFVASCNNVGTQSVSGNGLRLNNNGGGFWLFDQGANATGVPVFRVSGTRTTSISSATTSGLWINTSFVSAGNAGNIYNALYVNPAYNCTGGTQTIYGIYYNPTLTSVTGVTHYGIVSAPTAALSGFGTSTPTATLHVVGSTKLEGSVVLPVAGNGLSIKEGTNATMGTATLSGGSVTVNTTAVTTNSRIYLSVNGGTLTNVGSTYISARTAGTSFTIASTNVLDASNVAWVIIEPAP